jgi:hypothetical protein
MDGYKTCSVSMLPGHGPSGLPNHLLKFVRGPVVGIEADCITVDPSGAFFHFVAPKKTKQQLHQKHQ